jgi:hypothetical protein
MGVGMGGDVLKPEALLCSHFVKLSLTPFQ